MAEAKYRYEDVELIDGIQNGTISEDGTWTFYASSGDVVRRYSAKAKYCEEIGHSALVSGAKLKLKFGKTQGGVNYVVNFSPIFEERYVTTTPHEQMLKLYGSAEGFRKVWRERISRERKLGRVPCVTKEGGRQRIEFEPQWACFKVKGMWQRKVDFILRYVPEDVFREARVERGLSLTSGRTAWERFLDDMMEFAAAGAQTALTQKVASSEAPPAYEF